MTASAPTTTERPHPSELSSGARTPCPLVAAALRRPVRRIAVVLLAAALGGALVAPALGAQQADSARAAVRAQPDSLRQAPLARALRDTLAPPVSPGRAFLLSLALPGLGQARLNRPTAGAVYIAAEVVWIAMLAKSFNDLRIAKARAGDVLVERYRVDNLGRPLWTADGRAQAQDTIRSRYAEPIATGQGAADAQQRSRVKARRLHVEDWIALLAFNHLFSGADAFVSSQLWDLPAQVEFRTVPGGAGVGLTLRFR